MTHVTADEQREIDGATYDGHDWVLPPGSPSAVLQRMATKGLIRYWRNRWQLAPIGLTQVNPAERARRRPGVHEPE